MARPIGKLTALTATRVKQPGMYGDGGGLYLQVSRSGARSWIFRYWTKDPGRSREMGLGSFHVVGLHQARELAGEYRKMREQGIDPIEAREKAKAKAKLEAAKSITFAECAESYIKSHQAGWRNAKHVQQWGNTLAAYAYPAFGSLPVAEIDTALVLKAIEPIWTTKPEMASRVRGRIELILDWAKARGYRAGENPARWRGHLKHLLPARSKVRKVAHHPALPYSEIAALIADLHKREGIAAQALEFAILTAARSAEVLGAQWQEFDLDAAVWTVPASRMKAGKEHRVPLAPRAIEIIKGIAELGNGKFVFPGDNPGQPLAEKALWKVLHRMKVANTTVHGLRSTFRDWAAERTSFTNEICEAALAHTIKNKTEAAYRRTDLFEKRRRLVSEWAKFCSTPTTSGAVVPLRSMKRVAV